VLPEAEGPGRLVKQLNLLGLGLAIVRETDRIDQGIYDIIKKVVRDTVPQLRLKMLNALWKVFWEDVSMWHKTKDLASCVGIPFTSAKLLLEELMLLGLAKRDTKGSGKTSAFIWQPSDYLLDLVNDSNVFA
jgi:hypothetical protein